MLQTNETFWIFNSLHGGERLLSFPTPGVQEYSLGSLRMA